MERWEEGREECDALEQGSFTGNKNEKGAIRRRELETEPACREGKRDGGEMRGGREEVGEGRKGR